MATIKISSLRTEEVQNEREWCQIAILQAVSPARGDELESGLGVLGKRERSL